MIKSLFTNGGYNKRFLKILNIEKLRDVKNGSEYIGKKGNPIYNDIKKKYRFINNTHTKSIQKQVKSIDVDKVGNKKRLASKSCFVEN